MGTDPRGVMTHIGRFFLGGPIFYDNRKPQFFYLNLTKFTLFFTKLSLNLVKLS